jgi:fucose permease
LSALGTAFQDAQANTFVASVKAAHRWLGVIHASYGIGCVAGPLVAAAIASSDPKNWMRFYFFPMGLAILNFGLASWAFKQDITIKKGTTQEEVPDNKPRISKAWDDMKAAMGEKSVWLLSLFFFFHLGVAITAGGK